MNTRAAASSSACRVCAWRSARVRRLGRDIVQESESYLYPDSLSYRSVRTLLRIAMAVAAVNVWTGSPLAALWIGSRLQGAGPPKMGPVFVVLVLIAVFSL